MKNQLPYSHKKTYLAQHSEDALYTVAEEVNNCPRSMLKFKIANQSIEKSAPLTS